jgi:hypothetical protein
VNSNAYLVIQFLMAIGFALQVLLQQAMPDFRLATPQRAAQIALENLGRAEHFG